MLKLWKRVVLCCITSITVMGCTVQVGGQDKSQIHDWVGQWRVQIPGNANITPASLILTPEGKAYVVQSIVFEGEQAALELPLERMSAEGKFPDNIRVATLDEVFTRNANHSKQSEAKTYTGVINRGQQVYFLENNKFADSIESLELGISEQMGSYRYQVNFKIESNGSEYVVNTAVPLQEGLKSYAGVVFIRNQFGDYSSLAIICESKEPSTTAPEIVPPATGENFTCPLGSTNTTS